jgi:hypothetical protein
MNKPVPLHQSRHGLARLVAKIKALVRAEGAGLSVTEANKADDTHADLMREAAESLQETPHATWKLNNLHANYMAVRAECEALRAKAARYDWLRDRLRVRGQRALSGGVRDGIEFRVGRTFLDAPSRGSFGYLDPAMYYAECDELDAAIDDAMGKEIGK